MMKMMVEVEVISRETIRPSSPTPPHLASFKLSYLDQLSPTFFVPIILFYTKDDDNTVNNPDNDRYCNHLKESLSKCLTSFYPLAGRVKENASEIDCNDAGVDFFVARVMNCDVLHVANSNPDSTTLNRFLPYSPATELTCNTPLLAIQVNAFECGGIAVAVCISHKVADVSSLSIFLKSWTSTGTSTSTNLINPSFNLASFFPMREYLAGFQPTEDETTQQNKFVTKRFVFDASSISSIRHEIALAADNIDGSISSATRVEAVSAFILKRFMGLGQAKGDNHHKIIALYAVNLRKRRVPPVPESFGNMCADVIVPITSTAIEKELNENNNIVTMASLVSKIRAAIQGVDEEYVKKLEITDWYLDCMNAFMQSLQEETLVLVGFSSWCRFGLYEIADFGWGKPIWVATSTLPIKNAIVLMDTRSGDGIEAWVNMLEEEMIQFEGDAELLAVASSDHQII